ncbi:ADP,ATP carrier protein 1, chloroplastic [Hondaea fermentalgiana]|uniref:ADP,ATP carrier protein n=1 Tax=Hondaea fermentalgiana TaxID=2315210 RepID=A0A2R5G970_9STRA|nr:ADP,ATP carrier protein 1, chloroplastic [Hondaea fermentalgiana]|eukprot:GBG24214.1 ADP,ATP carrier protein 1, chloroplastic [Hondaea fermentalgiana]
MRVGGHLVDRLAEVNPPSLVSSPEHWRARSQNTLAWLSKWLRRSISAPLMLMYLLLLLINTLLRDSKDTLLVTSAAGVEAIPILKSWVVIPASFAYFVVYYKLSEWLSPRQLFMVIIFGFNAFYLVFAWVLFPIRNELVPEATTQWLREVLPPNAQPLRLLIENWLLGLFYVISELWASAVCQLMFWKVANEIVSVEDAKGIYPLIGACGNLGMVVAGHLLREFANERDIVAAHAYLRVKSSRSKELKAARQVAEFEESVGYSVFSDILLPFTGQKMDPLDQAWQGTLLGISLLMILCSVVIMIAYDVVHRRQARLERLQERARYLDGANTNPSELGSFKRQALVSSESQFGNGPHDSMVTKRRTGSGAVKELVLAASGDDARASGLRGSEHVSSMATLSNSADASGHHTDGPSDGQVFSPRLAGDNVGLSTSVTDSIGAGGKSEDEFADQAWADGKARRADDEEAEAKKRRSKKVKVSMLDGLRALAGSTPLRCAAILVVSYGISISLVEVSWKGQVKKALEKPNDYSRFMGMFWQVTGLVSMAFMIIGRVILQRVGYAPAVLFTPVCMAVAGSLFFLVSILSDLMSGPSAVYIADSIPWAAYFGGAAVLFAKAAKYAFFDATKEIIFIPLDASSKNLGKAAIDVVAYRLSKSGGSVVLQIVIFFFGSISSSSGCIPIALVFGVVVVSWIHAALSANSFIKEAQETTSVAPDGVGDPSFPASADLSESSASTDRLNTSSNSHIV